MNKEKLAQYLVRLGDSTLIMGQRLTEWCGHGPFLEEDIAISNLALDYIGQTQLFYDYAVRLNPELKDQDHIAYFRDGHEFQNFILVEMPNGDFAMTMAKLFLFSTYKKLWFEAMSKSDDIGLSEISVKALKETDYHFEHSKNWMLRLGDGTAESKVRLQTAIDDIYNYAMEFFKDDALDEEIHSLGIGILPSTLKEDWLEIVTDVFKEATLTVPEEMWIKIDAKKGIHSEHLGHILAEMQYLQRAYPGNEW